MGGKLQHVVADDTLFYPGKIHLRSYFYMEEASRVVTGQVRVQGRRSRALNNYIGYSS